MARQFQKTRCCSPHHTVLCAALLAILPTGANAAGRFQYELGAALLHSDNIRLSEFDRSSDTVLSPRIAVDYVQDGPALQINLRGNLQYLTYLDNTFEDDMRGELSGELNWIIAPERMTFEVKNSLTQQSVDTLTAFTPGNQQQINIFEAGPSFFARFGPTTLGQLDLRYTNSYAEETETFNSDRFNVAARLLRQLNATDSISLNAEATRVEFDTIAEFYDYDRYDAFVNYRSELASFDVNVDLGYTRLEPKGSNAGSSSPLFRSRLNWHPSQRSTFNVGASYQYADATQDLIVQVGIPGVPGIGLPGDPNLQIIPDTFRERRFEAGYRYEGERLTVQVQPQYTKLRYIGGSTFDQDNYGVYLDASYRLQPQLALNFIAAWQEREFIATDRNDSDRTVGAGVVKTFTRHWSARGDLQHRGRDSNVGGQNYTENIIAVSVAYRR